MHGEHSHVKTNMTSAHLKVNASSQDPPISSSSLMNNLLAEKYKHVKHVIYYNATTSKDHKCISTEI